MEETPRATPENQTKQQELSRRQILKILGASGGALAASAFIPNTWVSPMVDIGVLPAHAQATGEFQLISVTYQRGVTTPQEASKQFEAKSSYRGEASFTDPLGWLGSCTQIIMSCLSQSKCGTDVIVNGTINGTITWRFTPTLAWLTQTACTKVLNDSSEESNEKCNTVPDSPI